MMPRRRPVGPLVATGLVDQVPSDSTVHRRHKELADHDDEDDRAGTTAVLAGMKTARQAAWAACGAQNPAAAASADAPLVLDLDATEILSHSDKEKAAPTWKKHYGFHPLAAIIDHGDGLTGEPAAVLLRPGNAGSNTADDHQDVLDQALAAIPNHVDGQEWGKRMLIRTDAAGGSQAFLGHLDHQGLAYSVGLPVTGQIGEIASTLGEDIKQGIIRADGTVSDTTDAYVADITSRMHLGRGATGHQPDKFHRCGLYPGRAPARAATHHRCRWSACRPVTNCPGHANRLTRSTGPGAGVSNASGI